jgi:hypothetical protein
VIFLSSSQESVTGVGVYQGPILVVDNFFDKFFTKQWCVTGNDTLASLVTCPPSNVVTRPAGAISFKRDNNYPSMTSSYVAGNSFGFCDNVSTPMANI